MNGVLQVGIYSWGKIVSVSRIRTQTFQDKITMPWHQYYIKNLADLTIAFGRNELLSKIAPAAFEASKRIMGGAGDKEQHDKQGGQRDGGEDQNCEEEKNHGGNYIDSPISLSTIWHWLRRLGFLYNSRKKTFLVDGNKRPNVVFNRHQFCKDYLWKLEPRCHWWIYVTKVTVEWWKHERLPFNLNANANGYSNLSDNGIDMVEFHVNDHELLQDVPKEMGYSLMGGNLSVREPESPSKPLVTNG